MNPQITLGTLYADHFQNLFRKAQRLCGNPEQAEDLALETIEHAAERLKTFRGGSLKGWLYASLHNRFLDLCRKPRAVSWEALDGDFLPARVPGPEAQVLAHLLIEQTLAVCHDPGLFRTVVLDGESLTDVARLTGENLNTLTARLRRDRQRVALAVGGSY